MYINKFNYITVFICGVINLIILLSSFVVFYIDIARSWVGGYSKIPLIWKPQD